MKERTRRIVNVSAVAIPSAIAVMTLGTTFDAIHGRIELLKSEVAKSAVQAAKTE